MSMAPTGSPQTLSVTASTVSGSTVLHVDGVLDNVAYLPLRDKIIQEALEEPAAVIIDVSDLAVPTPSAWLAFTSARSYVNRWPEVPIALVCRTTAGRDAVARSGATRYVPVYPTIESALDALPQTGAQRNRRRARADLPATKASLQRARELVAEWLTAWSQSELIAVTKVVVTAFVENVLQHTDSRPRIRLETDGAAVVVAVEDSSHIPAGVREPAFASPEPPSGLRIVSILCRMWGNAPTSTGKAVWAVIGPENRL
jgi:hypothetical protein